MIPTRQGDQRSPGVIPLALKDAFSIIQEIPSNEFLLRVSYLEIYNEVVNDLLNPTGQNLRIREDGRGTFVEGVMEEVILSPAHALSLIAAGEEHRHVGSTNFNLLSSRSHTIFTLTIERSHCGENCQGEAVNLSQLNLVDLAGSESYKAEAIGLRRKEGSYINKSLLTLGTVISKLTNSRAANIPYTDSKLTRILQSSLSGRGRISIVDKKSLIKKYHNEIRSLKEELEQLKRGIVKVPRLKHAGGNDIALLKKKPEDVQVKLHPVLEQEEAQDALLTRIQRLTKLILVSTKSSHSSRLSHHPFQRRRHSFGEEELAYLPHISNSTSNGDNIDLYMSLDGSAEASDDALMQDKDFKKPGLFSCFEQETSIKTIEQIDLLKEQQRVLSGEVAIHLTALKWLSREAARDAKKESINVEITKLNDEIRRKKEQISQLEDQIAQYVISSRQKSNEVQQSRSVSELETELNEKAFELELKKADNRVIQEQLNQKIIECEGLRETVMSLKQLAERQGLKNFSPTSVGSQNIFQTKNLRGEQNSEKEITTNKRNQQAQAVQNQIEQLKQKVDELRESKSELEAENKRLAEESSYAKELASAAAVELKTLSEEVTKLINDNERLSSELAAQKKSLSKSGHRASSLVKVKQKDQTPIQSELRRQLREKEKSYEAMMSEKDKRAMELRKRVNESQEREARLENDLANMCVLVAKLKKSQAQGPHTK